MFKPAKMVKIDLIGIKDEVDQITSLLAEAGVVHFSPVGTIAGLESVLKSGEQGVIKKRYRSAEYNFRKINDMLGEQFKWDITPELINFSLSEEIGRIETFIDEFTDRIEGFAANIRIIDEEIRKYEDFRECADCLRRLNIKTHEFSDFEFLFMKVGFVPNEKIEPLRLGVGDKAIVITLAEKETKTLLAIVSLKSDNRIVEKVLEGVFFQELIFPSDLHGGSEDIYHEISRRIDHFNDDGQWLRKHINEVKIKYDEQLRRIAGRLAAANLHFYARSHFSSTKEIVVLSGWVPERSLPAFDSFIAERKKDLVVLKDYSLKTKINVPTKLENIWLFKPFESLISTFGLPEYKEIDPSFYVMIGFALMFGMMFGDLGQGAVIAFCGWLLRKKKKTEIARNIGFMLMTAGCSASIFGLLFGNVFGFEHLIPTLLFKPFEEANLVLVIAIVFGVCFLSAGVMINIVNKFMQRNYVDAFLGQKSISGILFYYGAVLFVFGMVMDVPQLNNAVFALCMIFLPLVFVALKDPVEHIAHHMRSKKGHHKYSEKKSVLEVFVMSIMEVYDTILGYLSNTMSFMRVAAFSLNHVGLLLAVFTIGEMMDPARNYTGIGFWITIILGNVLVIVLEGMIVTIQTLRLIYYEGFSKFFSGEGIKYDPFTLKTKS